jgi:hypothetical protein
MLLLLLGKRQVVKELSFDGTAPRLKMGSQQEDEHLRFYAKEKDRQGGSRPSHEV